MVGFTVSSLFLSGNESMSKFFAFLGANAIVWTLIEIRAMLRPRQEIKRYTNLRDAGPHILSALSTAVTRKGSHATEVIIIGGRLQTVSELLSDFFETLPNLRPSNREIFLKVAGVDPKYLDSLNDPTRTFTSRKFGSSVPALEAASSALLERNASSAVRAHKISISMERYCSPPSLYAFLIDDQELFWGFYTWDNDEFTFNGASNPCFHLSSGDTDFADLSNWISSEYVVLTRPPGATGPHIGSSSFPLEVALETNLRAFDEMAGEYRALSRGRRGAMEAVLREVLNGPAQQARTGRVLELGAGEGYMTKILAESCGEVVAVEISSEMVDLLCETLPQNARVLPVEFLGHDFGDETYDLIVAVAFLHLFPSSHTIQVLAKMRDLLSPSGLLYLSTTEHANSEEGLFKKSPPNSPLIRFRRRFTHSEVLTELSAAGFEVVEEFRTQDVLIPSKQWMNYVVSPVGS